MTKPKIQISKEMWTALNGMKKPGESFDSVIRRLVECQRQSK